ncbi:MAG: glutamine--tRNA ligase/YqeY domain fusion protein [Gammaproteobacteria bacterium]|jgi:glutaminyl-tRNA synthetase|nr:glutamine--tRNA ligase/YqeY domain fusion protein [Gammaproteobacteria bacterium]MBT7754417.1 glutamine--tRNA ligase/YqeY domain fusion protein [Gammaproteobacteria bacterium]
MSIDSKNKGKDFIRHIIDADLEQNKNNSRVCTRFPPEPNGFLHIGHAQSICLNFGIAKEYNGKCYLRFDDTNPAKEKEDYVRAIKEDIDWLGFNYDDCLTYASDYFEEFYQYAMQLIADGKAYVDSQHSDDIKNTRGTLSTPGIDSPYRERSISENEGLFERMRSGEFENGENVLRAKIDMSSPNMNLRDPIIYRILHLEHQRTGNQWCIYPMYDFAHTLSDAIEGITHSLCTLEFEDHRPLYEWFLDQLVLPSQPRQIEFSRLNIEHTITSKRKLAKLVSDNTVNGWDDPRMPTISGMRNRGYTPSSIKDFCKRVGITKKDKSIQMALLENSVREDLDVNTHRRMAVLDPLKIVIRNYDSNKVEWLEAVNHPKNPDMGKREMAFGKEIYIERTDFMEDPPSKFFRLKPGGEVRLRFAYIIKCEEIIKDASGNITEVHCSYDPDTKSGTGTSEKKVKGTIHWVSAKENQPAQVNLFEALFNSPEPEIETDLNPHSLITCKNAVIEKCINEANCGDSFQFERNGYFVLAQNEDDGNLHFNRIITLRDSWKKIKKN